MQLGRIYNFPLAGKVSLIIFTCRSDKVKLNKKCFDLVVAILATPNRQPIQTIAWLWLISDYIILAFTENYELPCELGMGLCMQARNFDNSTLYVL